MTSCSLLLCALELEYLWKKWKWSVFLICMLPTAFVMQKGLNISKLSYAWCISFIYTTHIVFILHLTYLAPHTGDEPPLGQPHIVLMSKWICIIPVHLEFLEPISDFENFINRSKIWVMIDKWQKTHWNKIRNISETTRWKFTPTTGTSTTYHTQY